MKDPSKEKIVLLTLIDNSQIEGVLIKIDKENLKIILGKGVLTHVDGKTESFEKTEIFKKDIREIRIVEEKEKPKEEEKVEVQNKIDSTENKQENTSTSNSTFNAIPQDIQEKYINSTTKYDKGDFFDGLTISTNKENYKEVKTYNERNKETFGVDDTREVSNRRGRRKRYNNRGGGNFNHGGRGGYHGGYHNYNNNNNQNNNSNPNYNNNQNYGNYGGYYNNNQNYNNSNYNNFNSNTSQRGGFGQSRGGYTGNSSGSHFGVKSDMSIYSGKTSN